MTTPRGSRSLPVALLALLHPDGGAERRVVVDGSVPPPPAGAADLLVLAPQGPESAVAASAAAAAAVAESGLVYLYAPPRARIRLLRRLARASLRPGAAFVHVRGGEAEELLVQLERASLRHAVEALVRPPAPLRLAARFAPRPALRAAALLAPRVGVAVRRRTGTPLAGWLRPPGDADVGPLILRSVRSNDVETRLVYALSRRPIVAKVPSPAAERRALEVHAPAAARAGAAVPEPVALADGPEGAAAFSLLEGAAASTLLRRRPAELAAVVGRVSAWLLRWNEATATAGVVTADLLETQLLAHARLLEPALGDGGRYRAWLERRAGAWSGAGLPLVSAHLDLTMANVLLPAAESVGVVDWAQAREAQLPLVDYFYAVADAAAAADGYRDRTAAFRSCFAGGPAAGVARGHERALCRALAVAPEVRELCFHACWLHHAANEHERRRAASSPFLGILRVVAAQALASPEA